MNDSQWAGEKCFIVGGGPSLKDFDWSILAGQKHIIAVNAAVFDLPHAEVFITEDARFIKRFAPQLNLFAGVKVFSCPDDTYCAEVRALVPFMIILPTRDKRYGWSKHIADGLSTSSNSGIPALNLADILAADPIYLLGFDCRTKGLSISNYHAHYPAAWTMGAQQLVSFASDFEHWAAPNLRHRNIVNVISDDFPSALVCWDRISFKHLADRLGIEAVQKKG